MSSHIACGTFMQAFVPAGSAGVNMLQPVAAAPITRAISKPIDRIRSTSLRVLDPDDDLVARELRDAIDAPRLDVDDDKVLDTDARLALDIDAGLDREDGPSWERLVGAPAPEPGQLVRREPDSMPQAVP